jgi:hypothetical protein
MESKVAVVLDEFGRMGLDKDTLLLRTVGLGDIILLSDTNIEPKG